MVPKAPEMDLILKRFQKEKKTVVTLEEFMELAAPLVSGRSSNESTLDTVSYQLELFYVQLLLMYHHAMKGFMSSEAHVKAAAQEIMVSMMVRETKEKPDGGPVGKLLAKVRARDVESLVRPMTLRRVH